MLTDQELPVLTQKVDQIGVALVNLFTEADIARAKQCKLFSTQEYLLTLHGFNESTVSTLIANNEFSTSVFKF